MNERIKELAEQAENYAYSAVVGGSECQEAFIKKFAELIVKECINAVDDSGGDNSEYHINAIKKHFGEEE